MLPLPLYILAGGRSSRFGSDKARGLLPGATLIRRGAAALGAAARATRRVAVAAAAATYEDLGLITIADLTPGLGPLGGLHTALSNAAAHAPHDPSGWIILASCDWVTASADLISLLAQSNK